MRLEEILQNKKISKTKKYYDYDDIEYKGTRNIKIYLICQSMKIIINQ